MRKDLWFARYHLGSCCSVLQRPTQPGPWAHSASLLRLGLWILCEHPRLMAIAQNHICLVLMPALCGHTSPSHIFAYLHWDAQKFLDSCMSGVLCRVLSASPCPVSIFPQLWMIGIGKGHPVLWSSQLPAARGRMGPKAAKLSP